MSTQVFVITHKKFNQPTDPMYIPIHVGRAIAGDIGYLGDDTGDNISDLNPFYVELTGFYWLWRNYKYEGNIGLCHYRRFFIDEKGYMLKESDFDRILSEYDIMTSQAVEEDKAYIDYYAEAHERRDLELAGEVIRQFFPEFYEAYIECTTGKKHYFGNLMATSKELFDEYCEWLFGICAELGEYIDFSNRDDYQKRVFGFLGEQLLMVWVKGRGLKVYEGKIGIFDEKAETKELKNAIDVLLHECKVVEAKQLFYGVLKARPDLSLEHSDLSGDIPVIARILNMAECEIANKEFNLLNHNYSLKEMIEIVKNDNN